jgi:transcription termination/antitermination protein NusA
MLDQKQFALALKQVCEEKGLAESQVIETIESALAAAYRKDYGNKLQNIKVEFNPEDGKTKIYDIKTVVEDVPEIEEEQLTEEKPKEKEDKMNSEARKSDLDHKKVENKKDKVNGEAKESGLGQEPKEDEEEIKKFNPKTEIQISEAKEIKKKSKIGDELIMKLDPPEGYGRMAAQTAKQVIIQKLREAERNTLYEEIKHKVGQVVNGIIQRYERGNILVSVGKATALLPHDQQIRNESYNVGNQMKFYLISATQTIKGPEIIVSRRNEAVLKELFITEIPEIASGVVEIKSIAREAGERSKIAVYTEDKSIDPIGSCIGQRGSRIQTIINELNGEKVDIIEYNEAIDKFIVNSLSPAKISSVKTNDENKSATVSVKADQFSLAIGKGGQNARLAAKLTGWKIDITEDKEKSSPEEDSSKDDKKTDEDKKEKGVKDEKNTDEEKKDKDDKKTDETKKDKSKKVRVNDEVKESDLGHKNDKKTEKKSGDDKKKKDDDKKDKKEKSK